MAQTFFHPRQLYEKQHTAFLGGYNHTRFRYCEASSGSGKTWAAGGVALAYASNLINTEKVCWMTHTYTGCEMGFDSVLGFIPEHFREMMEKKNDIRYSHGSMRISLRNLQRALGRPGMGGIIEFRSAEKPNLIYGGRYRAGFVDEASRCNEESIHALLSTLNKGGEENPCWLWGNVVNRHNYFYRICRLTEIEMKTLPLLEQRAFYSSMVYQDALEAIMRDADGKTMYRDDGQIRHVQTRQAIEDARKNWASIPGMFEMLYENRPLSDNTRPFPDDDIDACSTTCRCGYHTNPYSLCPRCAGLSSKLPVAAGWDVARQVDYNCIIMLDEDGAVCELHHWWGGSWYDIARKGAELLMGIPTLLDISGKGDALPDIIRQEHPELWPFITPVEQNVKITGALNNNLIRSVQNREISFPIGIITEQLATIEAVPTLTGVKYEAPKGFYDDAFDALALAKWQLQHGHMTEGTIHVGRRNEYRRTGWHSRGKHSMLRSSVS